MPPANCDPHSRRLPEEPQSQRVVRVALYQRWPTLGEFDFLQSYVDSQPDWRVTLRSSDDGSGATLKRHGLQQVLTAARSGAIDVLVVRHIHSLSRTMRHLAFLLDELTSQYVRVVSAADPGLDTETPFGLFLVRAVSAVAEIEYTGARADRRAPSSRAGMRRRVATCGLARNAIGRSAGPMRRPTPSSSRRFTTRCS